MRFDVKFSNGSKLFDVGFGSNAKTIKVGFESIQKVTVADVEHYEGSYEVVPRVTAQILETKERYCTRDITVCEIPFFDVSNNSGGSTVYIGKEAEINGN